MKKVATVNGVNVYSDKKMTSINNDTVQFSDGSYANTSTGSVVNNGPGSISINDPAGPESTERIKKEPEVFNAPALYIETFDCDINIEAREGSSIELSAEGDPDFVKGLSGVVKQDTLYVTSPTGGSSVSISSNEGSVVVSGGSVTVKKSSLLGGLFKSSITTSSSSSGNNNSVTLKVPIGTAIQLNASSQAVFIGDVDGNLNLHASGQSECQIGSMKNASIALSGQSEAAVSAVNGTLSTQSSGQSSITVKSGSVSNITAQSSGQSDIVANVQAENGNLSASGQSDISVAHIKNKPLVSSSGMSDVTVKNW